MKKEVAGVSPAWLRRTHGIVPYAEVLLKHENEKLASQSRLRTSVVLGEPGVRYPIQVALGLALYAVGPLVKAAKDGRDVEPFRPGKARGAKQVHSGDVDECEFLRVERQQP
jgi:hypothetical protein